ncbi:MAG: hypothetical protein R6U40_06880 [Desulfobacterales bacterium]
MQDWYYADHRDLLKWGVLILLARQYRLSRIIQIAYKRPSLFPKIDLGGQEKELPSEVCSHFRDINNITVLRDEISISVFDKFFEDRKAYQEAVIQYLGDLAGESRLVFLDPDTGLEPAGRPKLEHVLDKEALAIWSELKTREVFAFYQHKTNRSGKPWIEEKRIQLEKALKVKEGTVHVGKSMKMVNDVVIFYAKKPLLKA